VGKEKSCLRFEGVAMSGSGNSGAVTWSEMTDSPPQRVHALHRVTSSSQSHMKFVPKEGNGIT